MSSKTVADIRSVLLLILEHSRQRHYPCGTNGKVFCPRNQLPCTSILTRAEQSKLETVIFQDPEPTNLGIIFALYSGLRIGEACALQWADFHLESGTVRVSKTMLRVKDLTPNSLKKTRILIDHPKTEESNRIIPLPSFVVSILRGCQKEPPNYLLTGTEKYMEPRVYLDK